MNNNITKFAKFLFLAVLLGVNAWALPSTASTNLQVSTGVTTGVTNNTLTVNSPDKGILIWQNFGSGADTVSLSDTLNYVLPSAKASVLNIVTGNASSTIDGSITSNGGVYILNPNGIVIGNNARIDVNRLHLNTSDNTAFASYYFQQNGKLPSQDGLAAPAGTTTITSGAIINITDNIAIVSKNVTGGGFISQGSVSIVADGNVTLGTSGLTYIRGNLDVSNPTGTTTLGTGTNSLVVNDNITVTGTIGSFNTSPTANVTARTLTVTGGVVNVDRVNVNTVTATGTNVIVNVGSNATTPVVTATASTSVAVTAPGTLTANVTNTGAGATTVNATGALTLGKVDVGGVTGATFTGASITDTTARLFVFGPASFTATAGNVSITNGKHSFGPVSLNATGEGVVFEDAALNLGTITALKFTGRSTDYVFQTGALTSPATSITGVGNVTLTNAGNAIGSLTVSGNNVSVTNAGSVTFGNVNAAGTLAVVSTGTVTQVADTKVNAIGATTLTGTGVTLANAGNTFGAVSVDAGVAGVVSLTEETTLNVASLRAATATLKSLDSVITSGTNSVTADNVTIEAVNGVTLGTNFRSANSLSVRAGTVDLSLLSFATNLNSKYPTVIATSYKAPVP